MAESRLDRLKALRAKQKAVSPVGSPVAGGSVSDVSLALPLGPPVARNADGTAKSSVNGNDSFAAPILAWEPAAPRASLYVRIPTSLHEAEGSPVSLKDPALMWCLSLWSGEERLTYDVCTLVTPPVQHDAVDGSEYKDAHSSGRVIRLDVIPSALAAITLQIELLLNDRAVATSHTALSIALEPVPIETTVQVSGVSKSGAQQHLAVTPSLALTPTCPGVANVLLRALADGRSVVLAPFALLFHQTRVFHPIPSVPSAAAMPMMPLDYLHPGRSELYVTINALSGTKIEEAYSPITWPPLTVVMLLSRGNGEIVVGPQILGACKCNVQVVNDGLSPLRTPSMAIDRTSSKAFGLVQSSPDNPVSRMSSTRSTRGGFSYPSSPTGSATTTTTWTGSWKRKVRLGIPEDSSAAGMYTGRSNLHALFYFLAPPEPSSGSHKPAVVAFSYLVLHPDSPQLLLENGVHSLRVRGR